jgi:hypothetical protein
MGTSPSPFGVEVDMENDFRFFKLGTGSRIALSACLFAAGIVLELAIEQSFIPGLLVVVAGWFPLMLKKATNKPDDQGLEEWRPVPMSEIDRLDDGIRESRKLRRRTMSWAAVTALALGLPAFFIAIFASLATGRMDIAFVALNAAALFLPSIAFGRVKVFSPKEISFKMPSFRALLSDAMPEGVVVSPYIRFDKDASGADVPEDLRFMLELKRPPEDFVGIQIQAAVNNGPNGAVPYLYAVVLTKGKAGPSYAAARSFRVDGYVVEPGGDKDYGTVVIRQSTDNGGYETTPNDCLKLMKVCLRVVDRIRSA